MSAVGLDHSAVLNQRIDSALIDRDVQQPVTCKVKRERIACGQGYRAQFGGNYTLVADVGAQQGNVATVPAVDRPLVEDRARARTRKSVFARHEVGIGNGQGGRYQSTHIDRGALAEEDAVGVDQEHLSI